MPICTLRSTHRKGKRAPTFCRLLSFACQLSTHRFETAYANSGLTVVTLQSEFVED